MLQKEQGESMLFFSCCCNSLISNATADNMMYLRTMFENLKETTRKTGDIEILPYGEKLKCLHEICLTTKED